MSFSTVNRRTLVAVGIAVGLVGCSDSDNVMTPMPEPPPPPPPPVEYGYSVEVTNMTLAQPMSPLAVIAHNDSYNLFTVGEAASDGLEQLAEGGDNSVVFSEATSAGAYSTDSGAGILPPAGVETISFTITETEAGDAQLSLVTMLVNTNDAITAIRNVDISMLEVGASMTFTTLSYDSGTEANTEAMGTIPGPADSGEGFNASRDDIADQVTLHGGVVTSDDGLSTSVLNQAHRWDNPVLRVTISRTM